MNDYQFYPTPIELCKRAWGLFKNKHIERLLEPSAGAGDLLALAPGNDSYSYRGRRFPIDVIEIDARHHPILESKGYKLVGIDFNKFKAGAVYSHILLNPPFAYGCEHLLKAFEIAFDAEIVAIINAETLRNPYTQERKHLLNIIEQHGCVEYVENAFQGADVQREAMVDVALVYLRKRASASAIVGDIIGDLRKDTQAHEFGQVLENEQALMLPSDFVENAVLMFNAAVEASRQAAIAQARANHYANWLGKTMVANLETDDKAAAKSLTEKDGATAIEFVRNTMAVTYDDLKDRAWTHILNSTKVSDKLSVKSRRHLESEFQKIKCLEFSVPNIYGFLQGLSSSGWEIQLEMLCETFDVFSRYHEDNLVFFMGWKSNGLHRKCGMRLRTTRFILPGHSSESYQTSMRYETMNMLKDIDKSFAILDGKQTPEVGLADLFANQFKRLCNGERLGGSYFDVRYYPQRGTIHFFPARKDLVDRLNRVVGQHRKWLPPQTQANSESPFWKQYTQAEKFDAELRKAFRNLAPTPYVRISDVMSAQGEEDKSVVTLDAAIGQVLHKHGYDLNSMLEFQAGDCQTLLAA